jgi:hypothetical protein
MMTVAKEMNNGVALLLDRMKTHPDEFIDFPTEKHISSKWGEIISDYEGYLEPEDQQALKNGLKAIHQQHFTQKVIEELVDPKKSEQWSTPLIMTSTHSVGVKQAITTLEEIKKEYETQKKPKTIFGRLFNYQ